MGDINVDVGSQLVHKVPDADVDVLSYTWIVIALLSTLAFLGSKNASFSLRSLLGLQPSGAGNGKGKGKGKSIDSNPRCIVQRLEETNKNCVVFFGSQSGNAQDFAEKLAKEGHARFGLETLVADLDDYDYETLSQFPSDKVALFVLASYGEGEPTDNAQAFWDFIIEDEPAFADDTPDGAAPLQTLRYAAFGLGNSTYQHYNAVVRKVDASLQRLGAQRLGAVGEGDEATRTMEDSFLSWKEAMWESVRVAMNLDEHEARFEPTFVVTPQPQQQISTDAIYLGERSHDELQGTKHTPHGPHNPAIVKLVKSEELFSNTDRHCLHIELDLRDSGLSYQTGDHVAVWPMNADVEVDRFLRVFGLLDDRNTPIQISALDATGHAPIPSPTTYDAAVRYYLEIAGPVSRQSVGTIAGFATDPVQKAALVKLGQDKDHFHEVVSGPMLNLAQLIEAITPGTPTCPVPFAVLLECVKALQPRYYSISSSSLVQKDTVSMTVVVESVQFPDRCFKGISTNYLLALKQQQNQESPIEHDTSTYALAGPRNKYEHGLPIHIRHSTFRLPSDTSRPIVMIGPGTGVAPFRAFVQERAAQVQAGTGIVVGKSVLFYGCRKESEDFVYKQEWQTLQETLGDRFQLHTAFSRQTAKKVYVQDLLVDHGAEVLSLLLDNGGYLYICGDARMARQVQTTLSEIISRESNVSLSDAEATIRDMKSSGRFQVCASPSLFLVHHIQ
ncbi:NADPH-ferrihemoprotein reductase [Capronia epimyces CBS 606.96]|uniref:NADPH--cytochrome P450 reductase n=1 Tax=Capronia epimyces CBS 606.96 TaxID=1182542 RepID=W9Y4X3_9EURO|nr:NADPH-ferrihemoprotein reductase [Capronia epimyces CBS 606.96]EXJ87568.1 NADPH-ferrihemoprotein reductase [Capronia epimyces CBS 606.96]